MNRAVLSGVGLLAALLFAACPSDPPELLLDCPEDGGVAPTLHEVYTEIQAPICSNCHFAGGQAPSMSSPEALQALIGADSALYPPLKIIVPGDLRESLMYLKVMGGADAGYVGPNGEDTGALMPRGGPPLPEEKRALLRRWICGGAPE